MKSAFLKTGVITLIVFVSLLVLVSKVKAEPYGWSPSVDNSWGGLPACTDPKPDKAPILLQPNHPVLPKKPKPGEVVLYWHKVPGATGYNIYYGLSPRNYIYTAPDIGDTDNFTVGHLANRVYYFAVQAKKGCAASALSNEWAARPGRSGYILAAAPGFTPVRRKTTTLGEQTTTVLIPTPTKTAEVKGVETEEREQPSVYQPPQTGRYQPPAAIPTPIPTPKPSLWQTILRFFGLTK